MSILITGATGFIGSAVVSELRKRRVSVRRALRNADLQFNLADSQDVIVGKFDLKTDWSVALEKIDCVIHCAAHPHMMHEAKLDMLNAYRMVNVEGTRRLAEQSVEFGVKRLLYLSSIKVNGERTAQELPSYANKFTVNSVAAPEDSYGRSKWEAEQVLWEVAARTGLEVVVVRPPMVYGPGVKGNLLRLSHMVASGLPLPFGAINNKRSLIGLANLVDLLVCCIDHPGAVGQTLLVSDGEDLSTPQLIQLLAQGMGKSARLFPVPIVLLQTVGALLGKRNEIDRLVGSLQVDASQTSEIVNWRPPVSVENGVNEMVQWYLHQYSSLRS